MKGRKKIVKKLLSSDRIIIRFLGLYLLPEGLLRGKTVLSNLAGEIAASSLMIEFFKIFSLNLLAFSLIVLGNYILRVKYFAFGYLVPLAWTIFYGMILGTNSFAISMVDKMSPT